MVTWLDHIANEGPPTKPDASYRATLTSATANSHWRHGCSGRPSYPSNDNIKMLKRKISEIVGIKDPKSFWFTIDGRPIKGDTAEKANVGHFNITTESTIRIQLYIIGGDKNRARHYVVYQGKVRGQPFAGPLVNTSWKAVSPYVTGVGRDSTPT